jgi:tetratricopeptide (TPR) repeat protein
VWPAYASVLPGFVSLLWARWAMFHDAPILAQYGGDNPIANAPFWTGVMTAVKVAGYYLALFAWPARLSCDYSYNAVTLFGWTIASGQDLHAWLALAVVLGLFAVAAVSWRRQPAVTFFLGLAAIAFLPTSNLLFPIGTIMAERLMYVPLIGLTAASVLVLTLAGQRLQAVSQPVLAASSGRHAKVVKPSLLTARPNGSARAWATAGMAIAAAGVAVLAVRTVYRNEDWTSNLRLWSSAALSAPGGFKVYEALALETMTSDPSGGRVDEAIDLASRSIGIIEQANLPLHQQPIGLYAEAGSYRLRKAQLLAGRGSAGEARAEVARALTLLERAEVIDREVNRLAREKLLAVGRRPDEIHDVGSAFIYRTLATAYLGADDPLQAVASAEYLQRISPGHFDPHYMRGVAEAAAARFEEGRGNRREAEAHLDRAAINLVAATVLNPAHGESWSLLAKVYQYLAPAPPAVFIAGGGGTLNRENPAVPRHLQLACAQLLAQLRAAGLRGDAEALRGRMITALGVPEKSLDSSPGAPPRR